MRSPSADDGLLTLGDAVAGELGRVAAAPDPATLVVHAARLTLTAPASRSIGTDLVVGDRFMATS
ncbi:hypothetical protein [Nonomuraea turkmeniaca]|uniref:hypothetical protein n=1 Tax=Nonomuraea turkmeniaca TaxID=103838 RepID=UPI001B85B4FC|nr:hypothetical protein [Nonomuraea turkmeniaca]